MEPIILVVVAFITAAISAILGMGGGIILLGIMALLIPNGYMVIALHGVVQLVSNITRSYIFRQHIKRHIIWQYLPGAILGLCISAIIIIIIIYAFNVESANDIKVDFLKPLIGIFIIWFVFAKRPHIKNESSHFFGVGFVSGISTTFIGATGPLIAPFFLKGKLSKENIIANKIQLKIGNYLVAEGGKVAKDYKEKVVKEYMKWNSINIEINLNIGNASYTVYTCDFTHDYIDINADYRN